MLSLTNKIAEVKIFGMSVLLSERTASDVNNLVDYASRNSDGTYLSAMLENATVIRDGLKINLKLCKWYKPFRMRKLKKIISTEFLLSTLSTSKILELSKMVYTLEGYDDLKKNSQKTETETVNELEEGLHNA